MDSPDILTQTLHRIPWFLELSPNQIIALAGIAIIRQLDNNLVLFNEGDGEDCLYILLEGQMEAVVHLPGHGPTHLYNAEPLDIIGWSVLTPVVRQRTVTMRALTDCRILCFDGLILRQMCEVDHHLGFVIMRRIANVVASRLLVTRLQLYEILHQTDTQPTQHHQ
jgi:CRP-like cAMP-binding protein